MEVKITTISEEFEKARVKGFLRTRKGKLERVKEFERKGGERVNLRHNIHPGMGVGSKKKIPELDDVGKHLEEMGYKKIKEGFKKESIPADAPFHVHLRGGTEYRVYKHPEGHTARVHQSENTGLTFARIKGPKEHHQKLREELGMKPDKRLPKGEKVGRRTVSVGGMPVGTSKYKSPEKALRKYLAGKRKGGKKA